MQASLLRVEIRTERDVVLARQRVRQVAALLGFPSREQTHIATAASEIARNVQMYARAGKAEFEIQDGDLPNLLIRVSDQGPGIPHLQTIFDGKYKSATGMGLGIVGAKRLMDEFDINSTSAGTVITMRKYLPKSAPPLSSRTVPAIVDQLAKRAVEHPMEEVQQQNQELLQALEDVRLRQVEVERLNRELKETNRGVLALYAELDDKAEDLKRASELKSRFLSNMTHELRTPLNSIIMLTRLMLDGTDGEVPASQRKPVNLIQRSAESLLELVNDLLDLAKIEAGKVEIKVTPFTIEELFGALRGMFRPLLPQLTVQLIFEDVPGDLPPLLTDEGKLSQILRNLISNALKFTEKGEVRVSARRVDGGQAQFSVADTGIGIGRDDQTKIFQDFSQLEPGVRAKGTGLGLSISLKLAEMLRGNMEIISAPGVGSTFSVTIPITYEVRTVGRGVLAGVRHG